MGANESRALLAQLIIIGAVCIGAWSMLVQPRATALRELEEQIAESRSGSLPLGEQLEAAGRRMESVADRLRPIRQANALALDSSHLYGNVMTLAHNSGVRLERLQPSLEPKLTEDGAASATTVDMTVNGGFADVLDFLRRVQELPGYVTPQSLSIGPSGTLAEPRITARFTCNVLRFELPETLASMGELNNAE